MSSGKRQVCAVDGCDTLQQSPTGVCWHCRKVEKTLGINLKECATPGCGVQTSSSTGYCSQPGCSEQRGRKVSTEGKAARGQTPDSGSTPDASTDNEFSALQEDIADLREENAELKVKLQLAETKMNLIEYQVMDIRKEVMDIRQEVDAWKTAGLPVPYGGGGLPQWQPFPGAM